MVQSQRYELAVGTTGVACGGVGVFVVGDSRRGVGVLAALALYQVRPRACLASIGAGDAGVVVDLLILTDRTVLSTDSSRQEDEGSSLHIAAETGAGSLVAGLAVGVAHQTPVTGGIGVLAIKTDV